MKTRIARRILKIALISTVIFANGVYANNCGKYWNGYDFIIHNNSNNDYSLYPPYERDIQNYKGGFHIPSTYTIAKNSTFKAVICGGSPDYPRGKLFISSPQNLQSTLIFDIGKQTVSKTGTDPHVSLSSTSISYQNAAIINISN